MIARLALLALGLAWLSGCTSGGTSAAERLLPQAEKAIFGGPLLGDEAPAPEATPLTRAQLDQIPFATIAVSADDAPPAFVAAVADNGGNIVYQDQTRRSLVLRGGLLVASQGLGYNLSAVKHQPGADPIAEPRPLAAWPDLITRNYQFALLGTDDYQITVRCRYQPIARERIEIVELDFNLMRVEETCANGARRFTNLYWVDEANGFIWKSEQWLGPRLPPMQLEVIRPYAG